MRYLALATDFDGTLAHHGKVDASTLGALERLLASGRKVILVTGREIPDLRQTFDHLEFFEWIVAENGGLLYRPSTRESIPLADPPPGEFVAELRRRGVGPISVGGVIVATWEPHEQTVLETIHDMGLELQVIFNKGAVMVLPTSINKATGLEQVLCRLGLSAHNVVGIGDAENDHALLHKCECGVAVANALESVKAAADFVTHGDHGAGVSELIEELVRDDLRQRDSRLTRHHLLLGKQRDGTTERIRPFGINVLIAGPSGSGKSTVATGLLERIAKHKYQFCIVDPEGDYESFDGAITLGDGHQSPSVDELLQILQKPDQNVVLNLVGMPIADRPTFFLSVLPHLLRLRASLGRPHWLVIDEAHHLLPSSWEPAAIALPRRLDNVIMITVHPREVSPAMLSWVDTTIAVGGDTANTIQQLCEVVGEAPPDLGDMRIETGEAVLWRRLLQEAPRVVRPQPNETVRRRHVRKYAEGELPPDRSFYFSGPEGKLHLRAQNLFLFLQIGEGLDDATWLHHLRQGDYSRWFREAIKNAELAAEAEQLEQDPHTRPEEARKRLRELVEKFYTLPATAVLPMPGTDSAPRWVKSPA